MWFNINIDFTEIRRKQVEEWKKRLDKFADRVVEWVKSRTPEDTKDLLNSIWKTSQIYDWKQIKQSVKDLVWLSYTIYVEYWVMGKIYNYHKPKWKVFYEWIWAAMFRKTYFDLKDKFE